MSIALAYGNRTKSPLTFFTPLDERSTSHVFKLLKLYQGLKNLCKFFSTAAVLKSTDGTRVAVYEQWKEGTDLSTLTDPIAHPEMIPIREGTDQLQHSHEYRNLELLVGESTSGIAHTFERDHGIQFEVFKTQPKRWEKLFAHCQDYMKNKLASGDGLLSYTIHRSLDTTKLAIISHWESAAKASESSSSNPDPFAACHNLFSDRNAKVYKAVYIV